jgi:hypothetical protein
LTSHPVHTIVTSPSPPTKLCRIPLANNGQPHCTAKELGNHTAAREVGARQLCRAKSQEADEANAQERTRLDEQTNKTHAKEGKREREKNFIHAQEHKLIATQETLTFKPAKPTYAFHAIHPNPIPPPARSMLQAVACVHSAVC